MPKDWAISIDTMNGVRRFLGNPTSVVTKDPCTSRPQPARRKKYPHRPLLASPGGSSSSKFVNPHYPLPGPHRRIPRLRRLLTRFVARSLRPNGRSSQTCPSRGTQEGAWSHNP